MSLSKHKSILLFGILMGALFFFLQWMEYKFMLRELSTEVLIGLLALIFIILGIVLGRTLRPKSKPSIAVDSISPELKKEHLKKLQISDREYEVLELMAKGLSNQEIGEQLFISISTVKTHSSKLYEKLDANRRTQAVQKARELQIL